MHEDKQLLMANAPEKAPSPGKVKLKLICPLFPGVEMEADAVLLPAVDGDILILPNRAPLFLSLRAGRMIVYNKGQEPLVFLISSGISEIRRNLCPVLAWGGKQEKIDAEQIADYLETALKSLPTHHFSMAKSEIASRIEFFEMILADLKYDIKNHQPIGKQEKIDADLLGLID